MADHSPPPIGSEEKAQVEKIEVDITAAQGLLCSTGSLYVCVNGRGSGLYRVTDSNGDDHYDKVVKLFDLQGAGEHGPHALRLGPDGKSIYFLGGNFTEKPAQLQNSRIPTNWAMDSFLSKPFDPSGFENDHGPPGGWIARADAEGGSRELISMGYRNAYSMDFNADGELFAYDSDMEWDMGTPWYRPTRVVHAVSGSDFGWRGGTGKWRDYYADGLPALLNVGPGSPVGVRFGYGTRFPAAYQKALYILDWTFGTIYALHLEPAGASYRVTKKEEFVSRGALPLTDIAMGPDGSLYFAIGGRGTQSELFRVTYSGTESTAPADLHDSPFSELRSLRQKLESYHHAGGPEAPAIADFAYPYLGHPDRHIRYAARIAIEHQPVELWTSRVLAETDNVRLINGIVALARQGNPDLQAPACEALASISWPNLEEAHRLALLRAYQLVFIRLGEPDDAVRQQLISKLDDAYPAPSKDLNRELSTMLAYLESPTVLAKTLSMLHEKPTESGDDLDELLARNKSYGKPITAMLDNQPDSQQIYYAFVLSNIREGWTFEQRKTFFNWLERARNWSGGMSYQGFIMTIDQAAFDRCSDAERLTIESLGIRKPFVIPELPQPVGPGREWTLEEILQLAETKLKSRDFAQGQQAYAAARCVICHRFGGNGGATGPDLTQLAGRFNLKDLTEAITSPSKVIPEQYRALSVLTEDGLTHTGRVVAESHDSITMAVDPEIATKIQEIPRDQIEEMVPSLVSLMPAGLFNTLNEDEVLDLLAYLLSRGNPGDPLFKKE